MNFKEFYLNEMMVVGKKPQDGDYIIAFDKWIWAINDDMNINEQTRIIKQIIEQLKNDLGDEKTQDLDRLLDSDAYDFVSELEEEISDVLVGLIEKRTLHLLNRYNQFDPKSSPLVKKVVNQLKLRTASYEEDMDSTQKRISKNKMIGKIPDIGYHGTTTDYLERIMAIGLRPRESESNYKKRGIYHDDLVFFSTRIGEAMHHAVHTANVVGGVPVILEFTIPDKDLIIADYDIEKLTGSDRHYTGMGEPNKNSISYNKDPDKLSRQFGIYGYKGNIKPVFIKKVYVSKEGKNVYNIESDFQKMNPKTALKYLNYGYFDY